MDHEREKQTRNSWQKPLLYSLPGVSSTISQLFLLLPRTISLRHDIRLRAVAIVYFTSFLFSYRGAARGGRSLQTHY